MSVSKWAYTPEKCDGQPCVGDCDLCDLAYDGIELYRVDNELTWEKIERGMKKLRNYGVEPGVLYVAPENKDKAKSMLAEHGYTDVEVKVIDMDSLTTDEKPGFVYCMMRGDKDAE